MRTSRSHSTAEQTPKSSPMSTVRAVWPTVGRVVRALSLSRIQSVVATLAGVTSVVGATFSLVQFAQPANTGELIATVSAAGSNRSVTDATVEVLTIENALVATLTPDSGGRVTQKLSQGVYVVRVSHPRYVAEVRRIQVQP